MLSIRQGLQLVQNMGVRYVKYRMRHEIEKRLGIVKRLHPQTPPFKTFINLRDWRSNPFKFAIPERHEVVLPKTQSDELAVDAQRILRGEICFFGSEWKNLGIGYDWITNPDTNYRYDISKHWSEVNDFNAHSGDIKYVWEKSRFSYLLNIIRYDHNFGYDHSEFVFSEIERWIDANPINSGPNWRCSQEISLRVFNWCFVLSFYRDSKFLTENLWDKIQNVIFWSLHHVYHHIDFSRIAVRNNHAITETLFLAVSQCLFPFIPDTSKWSKKGRIWFEEEISFQIYKDGTYLQFSMNYHRVVVQLLTLGIRLMELHGNRFGDLVYQRAKKSLYFLANSIDLKTGWLPNYGPNDGALFFKLSDAHFRDYRPQLEALCLALKIKWPYEKFTDAGWFGLNEARDAETLQISNGISRFQIGGFYIYRGDKTLNLIRCGDHKTRPTQADNLHLDIWYSGRNIFHDGGSYKYNTLEKEVRYFRGTESHNTVMLGDFDQMKKGPRFIWYHWTQRDYADIEDTEEWIVFKGQIKAFQHIDASIRHARKIKIHKSLPIWEVEDQILNKPKDLLLRQLWHTRFLDDLEFNSYDDDKSVIPLIQMGYYSDLYGSKEKCNQIEFSTDGNIITTTIKIRS